MISIKKYFSVDNEAERVLLHAVRVLLQSLSDHAISGATAADRVRFQDDLKSVAEALSARITPDDLLVRVGAIAKAFEEYSRLGRTQEIQQAAELRDIVKMLTFTVTAISAAKDGTIAKLGEIERHMLSADELDDVRLMKTQLSDCLSDIRDEAHSQRTEAVETINQLRHGLDRARKTSSETPDFDRDPVTGLPGRVAAEQAFTIAAHGEKQTFATVFVLDRLHAVNLRFGRAVGDEVLAAAAQTIRQRLQPGDQLFRWDGPTLVALVWSSASIDRVRGQVSHFLDGKQDHTVQLGSRNILIPVGARWVVFPMMTSSLLLLRRIDTFAAVAHSPET